ncbi:MAG: hypothetical protein KC457_34225, partial [Myxococcales bacterium]|nr:hypothetical protein [Myxococcales bacterium]
GCLRRRRDPAGLMDAMVYALERGIADPTLRRRCIDALDEGARERLGGRADLDVQRFYLWWPVIAWLPRTTLLDLWERRMVDGDDPGELRLTELHLAIALGGIERLRAGLAGDGYPKK